MHSRPPGDDNADLMNDMTGSMDASSTEWSEELTLILDKPMGYVFAEFMKHAHEMRPHERAEFAAYVMSRAANDQFGNMEDTVRWHLLSALPLAKPYNSLVYQASASGRERTRWHALACSGLRWHALCAGSFYNRCLTGAVGRRLMNCEVTVCPSFPALRPAAPMACHGQGESATNDSNMRLRILMGE